jgi:hypothetical protein
VVAGIRSLASVAYEVAARSWRDRRTTASTGPGQKSHVERRKASVPVAGNARRLTQTGLVQSVKSVANRARPWCAMNARRPLRLCDRERRLRAGHKRAETGPSQASERVKRFPGTGGAGRANAADRQSVDDRSPSSEGLPITTHYVDEKISLYGIDFDMGSSYIRISLGPEGRLPEAFLQGGARLWCPRIRLAAVPGRFARPATPGNDDPCGI